jgi:hypothetical protein
MGQSQEDSVMSLWQERARKFGFDITKADKIFDLLLQQGQIKLS